MFLNLRFNLFINVYEVVKLILLRGKIIFKFFIEYVYIG